LAEGAGAAEDRLNPPRVEKWVMLNYSQERLNRRQTILEGISQDLTHSEIAAKLGVNRWVVMNDIRFMQRYEDPEYRRAQEVQEEVRAERESAVTREKSFVVQNERFVKLMGMSLREKSFRNMVEFYGPELRRVLKSVDQNAAIMMLPKSVRRALINNGIITKGRRDNMLTPQAVEYLT